VPGPRILVADDHDKVRAGIATLLASHFDVVATVRDGHEAVEADRTLSPDLVVLDISMPGLNGFQAGALIRDLPDPPRIVFATAHEDSSIANAAFALGASAVVQKRERGRGVAVELRLIAGPIATAAAAARLCAALNAAGAVCTPATFEGQRLAVR